jgi:hypothetical protein
MVRWLRPINSRNSNRPSLRTEAAGAAAGRWLGGTDMRLDPLPGEKLL